MKIKYLVTGLLAFALILGTSYSYGWAKFVEEPEFGSMIGMGAVILGTVVGSAVLALMIVLGVVKKKGEIRKLSSEGSDPHPPELPKE